MRTPDPLIPQTDRDSSRCTHADIKHKGNQYNPPCPSFHAQHTSLSAPDEEHQHTSQLIARLSTSVNLTGVPMSFMQQRDTSHAITFSFDHRSKRANEIKKW